MSLALTVTLCTKVFCSRLGAAQVYGYKHKYLNWTTWSFRETTTLCSYWVHYPTSHRFLTRLMVPDVYLLSGSRLAITEWLLPTVESYHYCISGHIVPDQSYCTASMTHSRMRPLIHVLPQKPAESLLATQMPASRENIPNSIPALFLCTLRHKWHIQQ